MLDVLAGYLSKIRVNYEDGLTRYKPLSAGGNADASDQTGVPAVHLSDTNTTIINTTHRNSTEETQTARDHLRTRSGLYYFTLVHYHQTYSVDLLTFLFFNPVQKNDRQTLLHVCTFTALVYNFNNKNIRLLIFFTQAVQ